MLTHLLSLWQEYTTLCFGKLVFFIITQKLFLGLKHRCFACVMALRTILIADSHTFITDALHDASAHFTIYTCRIFLPCGNYTLRQGGGEKLNIFCSVLGLFDFMGDSFKMTLIWNNNNSRSNHTVVHFTLSTALCKGMEKVAVMSYHLHKFNTPLTFR